MSDIPVVKIVVNQETAKQCEKAIKPKKLWDNYCEIGTFQKSERLRVLVAVGVLDGVKYLNIREFYCRKNDGQWRPGRNGIVVPIKVPVENGTKIIEPYEDFMTLLAAAKEVSETMELYDEDYAVYI